MVLLLSDRPSGDDVELARMPLTGVPVRPQVFLEDGVAWLLAGSVRAGPPLRRTVGLRRARIRRGEAQLHNAHGLADYAAGELDSARREFDRAIAVDPGYVDVIIRRWEEMTGQLAVHAETGMTFAELAKVRAEEDHSSSGGDNGEEDQG